MGSILTVDERPSVIEVAVPAPRVVPRFEPAVEGLRAVAIGLVIAYHYGAAGAAGGFLGVDVFFVLTGYLITSLLLSQWGEAARLRVAQFWARRTSRLLPALFLVLIAVVAWSYFESPSDRLGALRGDALWSLLGGANWHLIGSGQSYFAAMSEPSMLKHLWFVAIQMQFLLVWPLAVFVCLRLARGRTRGLAAICIAGIAASTLLLAHLYVPGDPSRSYYGTDTRVSQLLVGALLAIVLTRWAPRTAASRRAVQTLGLLGAIGCVWAIAVATDTASWLYHGGYLAFAIGSALVIAALVQPVRSPLRAVLSLPPLPWVGKISYGLYLWHWPVMVALSRARTGWSGWRLSFVWVTVSFVVATASYYLVELPIRRRQWLGHPFSRLVARVSTPAIAAPVTAAVTALVLLGATAAATSPPRFLTSPQNKVLKSAAATKGTSKPPLADSGAPRMVLLGDSVAASLGDALQAETFKRGIVFQADTRPGCGLVTGSPTLPDRSIIKWAPTCANGTLDYLSTSVRDSRAQVVIWLSTWETADRLVDGRWYRFDTPSGDQMLLRKLEESRRVITATGARLVMLTVPPPAVHSDQTVRNRAQEKQFAHLNQLFHTFAAQHPESVTVVDFAGIVCPHGSPCAEYTDGIRLRPRDGGHFEGAGPAWVAPRLIDALMKAAK